MMMTTLCTFVLILSLGFSHSLQATLRTVALTGQQAPGTPSGAVFDKFSTPAATINNLGEVAFRGFLLQGSGGTTASNDSGYWSENGGALSLVVREGSQAPGTSTGIVFSSLQATPLLNDAGQIAFWSTLSGGGVNGTNDQGIWSNVGGSLALVAREGNQAPGLPAGAKFGSIFPPLFNQSGQVAFHSILQVGSGGVNNDNNGSLWISVGGVPTLLAREGSPAPGTPSGSNFGTLPTEFMLNNSGQVAFSAPHSGPPGAPPRGVWKGPAGGISLVARSGTQAPGIPAGGNFGGSDLQVFRSTVISDANHVAFAASLAAGAGGVTTDNDQGLWSDRSGSLSLLVREGDAAPGIPNAQFESFSSLAMNGSDNIAFISFLKSGLGGVTDDDNISMWSERSGTLNLIARQGFQAPGAPLGAVFNTFSRPTINAAGNVAFQASLVSEVSGTTTFHSSGIWAQDPSGTLELIARTGEYMDVAPGNRRIIESLQFFTGTGHQAGGLNQMNDAGQVLFWASFRGGSEGIFVAQGRVSYIPEPSSLVLAVLLGVAVSSRRSAIRC